MFYYCKIEFLKIIGAQNEFRIGPDWEHNKYVPIQC